MKMWLSHVRVAKRHIVGQSLAYQYDSLNFDSWVFSGMTVSRLCGVYQQPSVFYLIELRERAGKETNRSLHVAPGDDDDDYKSFSTFYRLLLFFNKKCLLSACEAHFQSLFSLCCSKLFMITVLPLDVTYIRGYENTFSCNSVASIVQQSN